MRSSAVPPSTSLYRERISYTTTGRSWLEADNRESLDVCKC